ncbi:MAG: DUF2613 family protein [Gordonia sp. (in: high G+C Gram-positive bacteria)]|uniref:DUF2613 family protein n=1 Tax=Gordonia sp. (in: high G+C Gram-positive bacteria) TaxID=84139 RepID=UPI0039E3EA63
MQRSRLISAAAAAVAGIAVGFGAIFLGGTLASQTKPSTDVNSFDAKNGFVKGSVEYGSRGGAGNAQ